MSRTDSSLLSGCWDCWSWAEGGTDDLGGSLSCTVDWAVSQSAEDSNSRCDDGEGANTGQQHGHSFFLDSFIVLQYRAWNTAHSVPPDTGCGYTEAKFRLTGDQPLNMSKRRLNSWVQSALLLAVVTVAATFAAGQQQPLPDAPKPQNNAPAANRPTSPPRFRA